MSVQVLISSSNWKWPDVQGLHDFEGELIHTASWPEEYDLTNKTVAVIGNGASGIQLIPAIQPGELSGHSLLGTASSDGVHRCQEDVPCCSHANVYPAAMATRASHDGWRPDAEGDKSRCERELRS